MAAGELIALAASVGDIDTSDNLDMCEAYQKVFIVNGANLKVADFINTKLTCSALTNPPAHGDILTQDQTGSNYAFMVVDLVNTAKTAVYGYAYYSGAATAFNITNTVTSNNATATMDATFTPTAVTAGPLWYDWTVYPNIVLSVAKYGQEAATTKSFGSLPNKAYIIALYRGRPVISGDPEHPNQWYMLRQANPFDAAYCANDAGSPVAGHDADAGEAGDITRALIPYKDDYLIIGCATQLWFISGDPAAGGSINELSLTAGILGAKAWAWDKNDSLYILGTTGILRIPPGFGPPENLTEESYPDFIKDLAYNPTLHRITMGYDKTRHGIQICKTTIADGSSECWWYDLRSSGLFPETYPDECGPYSMFYYDSNDPDDRGLLFGCRDGYLRVHDDEEENDNIGATSELIDSYVTVGPIPLGDGNKEGVINSLAVETVGGGSSGSIQDSNNVEYGLYVDRSADGVMEKAILGTSPNVSGTISAPGRPRGNNKRQKVRGSYAVLKLQNDTVNQTWGLEKIIINGKEKGRVK